MKNYVAPSLLSADKEHLKDEILKVEALGCEYIHWDLKSNWLSNLIYTS